LRRVGVEPRPDLVQGFTRNGNAGSSKDQKDGGGSFDDNPGDNDSDGQIPTSTMFANTVLGMLS
jgi:maspardin